MTGGSLTIREATPADRAAMLDLWVEAWAAARPEIDFEARRGWLDRHLDALHECGIAIFVASTEGHRIAGFMTLDLISREIDQLVTAVWAQRRGVGQALLRHAKRLSPECVTLSVNQFNTAAVRLYEAEGFKTVGEGVSGASGLPTWYMRWAGPERR